MEQCMFLGHRSVQKKTVNTKCSYTVRMYLMYMYLPIMMVSSNKQALLCLITKVNDIL